MATLTRKEWDRIRGRRNEADVKYVFTLLQRDCEITIEQPMMARMTESSEVFAFLEGLLLDADESETKEHG